mgnify:CR=1 FL=1
MKNIFVLQTILNEQQQKNEGFFPFLIFCISDRHMINIWTGFSWTRDIVYRPFHLIFGDYEIIHKKLSSLYVFFSRRCCSFIFQTKKLNLILDFRLCVGVSIVRKKWMNMKSFLSPMCDIFVFFLKTFFFLKTIFHRNEKSETRFSRRKYLLMEWLTYIIATWKRGRFLVTIFIFIT